MELYRSIHRLGMLAVLLVPLASALAQTPGEHDTGTVQMAVWDDGSVGRDAYFNGTGFVYRGQQGLFASNFSVAQSILDQSGTPYEQPQDFVPVVPVTPIPSPIAGFDQGFMAVFDDSGARMPMGLLVTQRSYSSTEQGLTDFVVLHYTVENASGEELTDLYVGNVADWDVGPGMDNNACYDSESQIVYAWSLTPGTYYYGVSVANSAVSGWFAGYNPGCPCKPPSPFQGMSESGVCTTSPGGLSHFIIGQGPYDIADGERIEAWLCAVGGDDEADLIANALTCKTVVETHTTAAEPAPDGGPGTHRLSPMAPNPFRAETRFTLTVAEAQHVRVAVYDALGRAVAVLHDGPMAAGAAHPFAIDGVVLPSGVYVVRVVGERFSEARRISLAR